MKTLLLLVSSLVAFGQTTLSVNGVTCALGLACNGNWISGSVTSGHLASFTGTAGQLADGGATSQFAGLGANTFTGIQTFSATPVLSTSALTSGAGTITFPTASITVPGIVQTSCGTSASCASPATESSIGKIVTGSTAVGSSSTLAITGISPAFTSSTSFMCMASDPSHNYYASAANQTTSAVTFTFSTSNSDTWQWACVGN